MKKLISSLRKKEVPCTPATSTPRNSVRGNSSSEPVPPTKSMLSTLFNCFKAPSSRRRAEELPEHRVRSNDGKKSKMRMKWLRGVLLRRRKSARYAPKPDLEESASKNDHSNSTHSPIPQVFQPVVTPVCIPSSSIKKPEEERAKPKGELNLTETEEKPSIFISEKLVQNTTTITAGSKEVAAPSKVIKEEREFSNNIGVKVKSPFSSMSCRERMEARSAYIARIGELNDAIDLTLNEEREVSDSVDRLTSTINNLKAVPPEEKDSTSTYTVELEITILTRKLSSANEDVYFLESRITEKLEKLKQFRTYVADLNQFYEKDKKLAEVMTPQP